jgi:hypothetical protein
MQRSRPNIRVVALTLRMAPVFPARSGRPIFNQESCV